MAATCNRCKQAEATTFGVCNSCFVALYEHNQRTLERDIMQRAQLCLQCAQNERFGPSRFCSAACAENYLKAQDAKRVELHNFHADSMKELFSRYATLTPPRMVMGVESDEIQQVDLDSTQWDWDVLDTILHLAKCPIYLQQWFDMPSPPKEGDYGS